METLVQNIVSGALVGALYGLAAMGLSLVFGVLKILNVAHGELIMIGGYASFWAFNLYGIDPFISLIIVLPVLFIVGLIMHRGLFATVVQFGEEHRIKNSLLIGFGLTLILQTLAVQAFTADERTISTAYASSGFDLVGLRFPLVRFAGLVIGILVVIALQTFLTRTYWGISIRATAEDWESAGLMGINVRRTYLLTFALGAALAGLAGTLITTGFSVSPNIGLQWTLKALIVVVMAGLGSVPGTFIAGILLGVAESTSADLLASNQYRELVGLVIFLIILSVRPQGLFGEDPHG